jgi:hypothetical protein
LADAESVDVRRKGNLSFLNDDWSYKLGSEILTPFGVRLRYSARAENEQTLIDLVNVGLAEGATLRARRELSNKVRRPSRCASSLYVDDWILSEVSQQARVPYRESRSKYVLPSPPSAR